MLVGINFEPSHILAYILDTFLFSVNIRIYYTKFYKHYYFIKKRRKN